MNRAFADHSRAAKPSRQSARPAQDRAAARADSGGIKAKKAKAAGGARPGAKTARKAAPPSRDSLWKKIAVYAALISAPCAAFVLIAFVWQMNTALEHIDAPESGGLTAQSPAAAAGNRAASPRALYSAADRNSRRPFGQFPPAGQAGEQAKAQAENNANLRFLHKGLLYSAALALISGLGAAWALLHYIKRDKHHRHDYQNLLSNADTAVEARVRRRTAKLEAARHLAEKERQRAELLLQDTSHRVGNSLAGVSSALGLQLRQNQDIHVQQALLSARDRIQSIAAAHRRLRLNADMETACAGDFLSAIIHDAEHDLLDSARRDSIMIETHFEQWHLPARDATSLGIILGELLTNVIKHAFPRGRKGRIYVAFGKLGTKHLRLIVEDDGIGLPAYMLQKSADAPREGLGRLIIERLAQQFGAAPQFSNNKKGGGSRIIIPLLNLKAARQDEAETDTA